MKCPRCGHEMTLDTHRKYALNMCYECGYIEGRLIDPEKKGESNFERMKKLNFNEMVAFLTLSLIHISEPTRLQLISYAVFCLKKKK